MTSALQICKAALEEFAYLDAGASAGSMLFAIAAKARAALEAAARVGDATGHAAYCRSRGPYSPALSCCLGDSWQARAAEEAVGAIVEDLSDRRGLKREWQQIDSEIQAEIRMAWMAMIADACQRGAR